jgi:hypothetical protein
MALGRVSDARWRGHVFGLQIDSSFPLAGCPAGKERTALPARVTLELSSEAQTRAGFDERSRVIGWRRTPAGHPEAPDVLEHPTAGWLVYNPRAGCFRVSRAGDRVLCAPADDVSWRWQRYLLGRVLPFVATLQGLEPWHASAVVLNGAGIALMAPSGVGKTTLAAALILAGARLLADDVIAVWTDGREAVMHPGPPLMSLRTWPRPLFGADELKRLGVVIGRDAGSLRLQVSRVEDPAPLKVLYVLDRTETGHTTIEPQRTPGPNRLIAGTFNFALRDRARLAKMLDAASSIARTARIVAVRIPVGADVGALASLILADASGSKPRR